MLNIERMRPTPRGLLSSVRAEGDPARVLAELNSTMVQFRDKFDSRLSAVESDVDAVTNKLAGKIAAGTAERQPDARTKMFAEFARSKVMAPQGFDEFLAAKMASGALPRAAMSVGDDTAGGFTVVPQFEQDIRVIAHDISPMRQIASVQMIGTDALEILVDPTLATVEWVGEEEVPDNEDSDSGKIYKARVPVQTMATSPRVTSNLLDDSFIDVAAFLTNKIATSFALKENSAYVSGDGVMKPRGFLSYPTSSDDDFNADGSLDRAWGSLQYTAAGSSTPSDTELADAIVSMAATLRAPYRPTAQWVTSRSFFSKIATLKDSQNRYLLNTADGRIVAGLPNQICGFPVAPFSEDMPAEGANSFPLALGDWSGYQIVQRAGIRVLRDPFTSKPFIKFFTTMRVGGAVVNFHALKLLKIATS